jgi:hypothetical protein
MKTREMLSGLALAVSLLIRPGAVACAKSMDVRIVHVEGKIPTSDASFHVGERPVVEGSCSDAKARIWLLIHSTEDGNFWVQPRVILSPNGSWRALPYVGRPGSVDAGKLFELIAVANPKADLREGETLNHLPEAEGTSSVVELTRD